MKVGLEERFWSKVDKGSKCWMWTANKTSKGYGHIKIKGKQCSVHRISYKIKYGPIPKGMFVCHHCDVRLCVNPSHLFIGTHKDNMRDASSKGRLLKGVARPSAKLTEMQVINIRKDTRSQQKIAKDYNVDQSTVSRIKRRETRKHVKETNDA